MTEQTKPKITLTCLDCLRPNSPMFMVHNELFLSVCEKKDYICLECFEKRLGREVLPKDLKPCLVTEELKLGWKIFNRIDPATQPEWYQ